jgi:hypothetical protein
MMPEFISHMKLEKVLPLSVESVPSLRRASEGCPFSQLQQPHCKKKGDL